MKRYCNSKGRIFLALCFLLCTGIFLLILYPDMASPGITDCATCTDCHNTACRPFGGIDWNTEKHGEGIADGALTLKPPYSSALDNKVLLCLDCHVTHCSPSPNAFLIREEVNGSPLGQTITPFDPGICSLPITTAGNKELGWLCRSCHKDDADMDKTFGVVNQWKFIHHYINYTPDAPYQRTRCYKCHISATGQPITCNCCHYHGSSTTDYGADYPCYNDIYICKDRNPYDRRTF